MNKVRNLIDSFLFNSSLFIELCHLHVGQCILTGVVSCMSCILCELQWSEVLIQGGIGNSFCLLKGRLVVSFYDWCPLGALLVSGYLELHLLALNTIGLGLLLKLLLNLPLLLILFLDRNFIV